MKLDTRRTILVGFAFMAICAFWQVYDSIVPLILKDTFDMNDTLSGAIMAADNVLALFLLPFFGSLSDRTQTRIGRRMPYILFGTALACVFALLLPLANAGRNLPLFLTALALVLLSMAIFRSPAVALMPDVTVKPLRSRANAIINLTGTIGGVLMLGAIAVLVPKGEHPNYLPLYLFLIAFMALAVLVLFLTVREPQLHQKMLADSEGLPDEVEEQSAGGKLPPAMRRSLLLVLASIFLWYMGYNAITTAFSKYANVYWGLEGGSFAYTLIIAQGAAIAAYIPAGLVATKIGRRKTILCGIAMLAVAFGSCAFFKSFGGMIFFFFVLAGVGWASINVNSYPMVVEMSRGGDIGKYTGYYYTTSMAAQVLTPILSGAVLEYGWLALGSADPNAGYVLLFPYGTLFVALSFVTMFFVRHGDAKPVGKKDKLEAFGE
ncbi:MAG: SLC45 family MFS transporter [Ruminococcaceae bacterium]|nr:SLC45 family MFS transporter [Oscillospiraceae bacterium]